MKSIEIPGEIDDQRRLRADVPEGFPTGAVRVIVLAPEEDQAGAAWAQGVTAQWTEELSDSRQDIYTLDDGEPVRAAK